jgi:hypothetical protein
MNTVEWLVGSTSLLAIALRGLANYGLSLSGMPCALSLEGTERAALQRGVSATPRTAGAAHGTIAGRR